ncbi:hypothetical protein S40285_09658 [Stachybotrys chlorohalonatus IBT 40285]|uniref:Uncharacterized protein n=1 Tax=Stachybotrys chlorohalonatus (strain IBT 40285) TaxID=1283841 RepID=A0A084QQL6_STAC4|nr:hypothetical protein S40285_09658 [Stachybotrys chlorohalonata IBT 40285]
MPALKVLKILVSPSGQSRKVCSHPDQHHVLTFQLVGYVDIETLKIGVSFEAFGAHILNLYGNLKDGVVGRIDLFLASGEIHLYLETENEVWLQFNVEVKFDGNFRDEIQLLRL